METIQQLKSDTYVNEQNNKKSGEELIVRKEIEIPKTRGTVANNTGHIASNPH